MKISYSIAFCIMSFLVLPACNKNDNTTTTTTTTGNSASVVGSWKETFTATDTNLNGKMDASERMPVDSSAANQLLVFDANGSFNVTENSIVVDRGLWTLGGDHTFLKIIDSSGGPDTIVLRIDTLTAAKLVLKDTTSNPITWTVFAKH